MKTFAAMALMLASAMLAYSQAVYTPEKGSAERREIMDALRVPVEKELGQKIVFAADDFRIYGNWAFLGGRPQTPSGTAPDYRRTPYEEARRAGAFDNNIFALLRKSGGRWKVVKYAIGCTDVCYLDWWRRFKAPKQVFPFTE
jgi:hypothetical protein